jgi:hypothetical protein
MVEKGCVAYIGVNVTVDIRSKLQTKLSLKIKRKEKEKTKRKFGKVYLVGEERSSSLYMADIGWILEINLFSRSSFLLLRLRFGWILQGVLWLVLQLSLTQMAF